MLVCSRVDGEIARSTHMFSASIVTRLDGRTREYNTVGYNDQGGLIMGHIRALYSV